MTSNIILTLGFFLAVLAVYYLVPVKYRWMILGMAGLIFYMSANPLMVLFIGVSTVVTWAAGICMEESETNRQKKKWLWGSIGLLLFVLFIFKYYNFFVDSVAGVLRLCGFRVSLWTLQLLVPMGISYYTFKMISYLADIYLDRAKAERYLGYYAVYTTFFPQILCGPIERAVNFLPQLREGCVYEEALFERGVRRIVLGLFKKVVIADRLASYVGTIFDAPGSYPALASILAAVLYSFQIYCDFSGYSDIAVGMSEMFGIRCKENFCFPYFSRNIKEFWNRWHISLSSWLKDYVYIPLGGNREGIRKKNRNLLLTFLASGLWHGSSWSFVIWGGMHGIWNMCSDPKKEERVPLWKNVLQTIVTFSGVTLTWIFFRAADVKTALEMIRHGIMDFSLSMDSITASLLPFTGDNTCAAFFLTVLLMILLLFFYELNRIRGKKETGVWFAVMLAAVLLFGQFGGSSFLYAQF